MKSTNDDAGLRALLDLARANGVRDHSDEMLKASLTIEAFARYKAMVNHLLRGSFYDRYQQAVKNAPPPPTEVRDYAANLGRAMSAYDKAKAKRGALRKRLEKAIAFAHAAQDAIDLNEEVIATEKEAAWERYRGLSHEAREWIVPNSGKRGWPPKCRDRAFIEELMPDEQLPWSKALAIVIEELLGER